MCFTYSTFEHIINAICAINASAIELHVSAENEAI